MQQTGVPGYARIDGNRGVHIVREDDEDVTQFTLISLWDSAEAIRQFAGKGLSTAVYYPKDENFLLDLAPEVEHIHVPESEQLRSFQSERALQCC